MYRTLLTDLTNLLTYPQVVFPTGMKKNILLLWVRRGARYPNLQIVITHALHACSQHSFGLPLTMNGMHKTQFGHTHLDLHS